MLYTSLTIILLKQDLTSYSIYYYGGFMKLKKNLLYMFALTLVLSQICFQANAIVFGGESSGGRNGAQSVYISFSSLGNGIDLSTYGLVQKLISIAQENNETTDYRRIERGREGEVELCVGLIDAFKRYEFIRAFAPSIMADKARVYQLRTFVYVGNNCDDINNATEQDIQGYFL